MDEKFWENNFLCPAYDEGNCQLYQKDHWQKLCGENVCPCYFWAKLMVQEHVKTESGGL